MKIKHNKKRNVGLIFEQLNVELTRAVIANDRARANACLKIIKENFAINSQLANELKIFKSLANIHIKNDIIISRIITEAKKMSAAVDIQQLSREKTLLIKKINETLGKNCIFDIPVEGFRSLATVQVLLNEWRKPEGISAAYTNSLEDRLITEIKTGKRLQPNKINNTNSNVNQLVVEMAKKKFFDKHKGMSQGQIKLIFEHIFMSVNQQDKLIKKYENLRLDTIAKIDDYSKKIDNSQYFNSKLIETKNCLSSFKFSDLKNDNECILRAITIKKLFEELENE